MKARPDLYAIIFEGLPMNLLICCFVISHFYLLLHYIVNFLGKEAAIAAINHLVSKYNTSICCTSYIKYVLKENRILIISLLKGKVPTYSKYFSLS